MLDYLLSGQKRLSWDSTEEKLWNQASEREKFKVYKSEWSILYEHKELPALPLSREDKVVLTNDWIDWLPDLLRTSSFFPLLWSPFTSSSSPFHSIIANFFFSKNVFSKFGMVQLFV